MWTILRKIHSTAKKIIESGGVFISEYPPGTKPTRGSFPKRNRILSAIGRATVVFEASATSGSLITARLAAEQGREIFVLPPADIFSSAYGGNVILMKEGALPVTSEEDITDFFRVGSPADSEVKSDAYACITGEHLQIKPENKPHFFTLAHSMLSGMAETAVSDEPDNSEEDALYSEDNDFSELEDVQKAIVGILRRDGRLHADIICSELDIDSAELMMELTELEIRGIIKSCPGRIYELL